MNASEFTVSDLLIGNLYQSAIMESASTFQAVALQQLNQLIGFDRAWWGIMSPERVGFQLRSSYRHELPQEFEEHWKSVNSDDSLASNVYLKPRTTVHFSYKELHSTPGLQSLNAEQNIRQALCTSIFLPDKKSFLFISLFRSGRLAKPFSQRDIQVKERLTPHLYSSWRTNLQAEIERMIIPNRLLDASTAFVDNTGGILCADPMFTQFANELWPNWGTHERLPSEIWLTTSDHVAKMLNVDRLGSGGLTRIDITRSTSINKLTPREKQIAFEYSEGRSYKEIAILLKLSPATVRHYLHLIYGKLNINDKAELVRLADSYRKAESVVMLANRTADGARQLINNL
ncbi:LuxR C-terminal-related transcriptional regulator [Methylobacillus caricis]|uniref:response regulator transcription factor n=1 Tax=Methylobacillus caricis TaxID=1971611 RepID=UPI001CFF7D9A|nr:helix-turn-helix transcriptional regulator [Methylobacillus caricis]MCB5186630.1 LuxR C-terminal-related transcriptional regulator [Methylobacillus caricis]